MQYMNLKAAYLKKMRIKKMYKLETLSKMSNYSVSYLNDIENNKRNIDDNVLGEILSSMGFSIPNDEVITLMNNKLEDLVSSIYYMDYVGSKKIKEELDSDTYINSPLFLNFQLTMLIYQISTFRADVTIPDDLLEYNRYLTPENLYGYKLYAAASYILRSEYDYALFLLDKLKDNNQHFKMYTAMLYYYLADVCFKLGNYLKAYSYLQKSKIKFTEDNNIFRECVVLQQEANIHSEQRQFREANQDYRKILFLIKSLNNSNYLKNVTLLNYSYCLLKQKKSKEALNILKEFDDSNNNELYIFTYSCCLYKTDEKSCEQYISKVINSVSDTYVKDFLNLLLSIIIKEKELVIENQMKYINKVHYDSLAINSKEFLLDFQLEYYTKIGKTSKQKDIYVRKLELNT